MSKHATCLDLMWEFIKVGLFTFGGGYAMIPILEDLCVENKKWLTSEEMTQTIAIAESTPGPIAINCATFVGYRQRGWIGALSTTFGICLPSFAIIYIISIFFKDFLQVKIIASAFEGIKIGVGILVLQSGLKMAYKRPHDVFNYSIIGLSILLLSLGEYGIFPISSIWVIVGSLIVALTWQSISRASKAEVQPSQQKACAPKDNDDTSSKESMR